MSRQPAPSTNSASADSALASRTDAKKHRPIAAPNARAEAGSPPLAPSRLHAGLKPRARARAEAELHRTEAGGPPPAAHWRRAGPEARAAAAMMIVANEGNPPLAPNARAEAANQHAEGGGPLPAPNRLLAGPKACADAAMMVVADEAAEAGGHPPAPNHPLASHEEEIAVKSGTRAKSGSWPSVSWPVEFDVVLACRDGVPPGLTLAMRDGRLQAHPVPKAALCTDVAQSAMASRTDDAKKQAATAAPSARAEAEGPPDAPNHLHAGPTEPPSLRWLHGGDPGGDPEATSVSTEVAANAGSSAEVTNRTNRNKMAR